MAESSAIVLFAHGARDPEWALPFERLRERLRASGLRVELAFLESMSPSLEQAADALAREGLAFVTVVPLFLAQGGHLKKDLPALVDRIRARHEKTEFRVTSPLGEAPEMLDAIAAWVQRASARAATSKR